LFCNVETYNKSAGIAAAKMATITKKIAVNFVTASLEERNFKSLSSEHPFGL
jgi:hypothetical protein